MIEASGMGVRGGSASGTEVIIMLRCRSGGSARGGGGTPGETALKERGFELLRDQSRCRVLVAETEPRSILRDSPPRPPSLPPTLPTDVSVCLNNLASRGAHSMSEPRTLWKAHKNSDHAHAPLQAPQQTQAGIAASEEASPPSTGSLSSRRSQSLTVSTARGSNIALIRPSMLPGSTTPSPLLLRRKRRTLTELPPTPRTPCTPDPQLPLALRSSMGGKVNERGQQTREPQASTCSSTSILSRRSPTPKPGHERLIKEVDFPRLRTGYMTEYAGVLYGMYRSALV